MAYDIKNAYIPSATFSVRSVVNPNNAVEIQTNGSGVASINEVELAIRLVERCGWTWVSPAPPSEAYIGEAKDVVAAGQYDVTAADCDLTCDATAGAQVVMLPVASPTVRRLYVKKTDATANTVTVNGNGATIDGAATFVLDKQHQAVRLVRGISTPNWRVT